MKPEIITKTITETFYKCPFCEFESKKNYEVGEHYSTTHACEKTIIHNDHVLYKFDTKENAEYWLRARTIDEYVKWEGAGWYLIVNEKDYDHSYDCFRTLIKLETHIEDRINSARYIMDDVISFKKLLKVI